MNLRKNLHRYINLYNYVEAYRNTQALPSGYTKLEYIESSGTQYINIGNPFTTNSNIIEAGFVPLSPDKGRYVFGAMNTSPYVGCVLSQSGKFSVVNNNSLSATITDVTYTLGNYYDIILKNSSVESNAYINGKKTTLQIRDIPTSDMIIFAHTYNGTTLTEDARFFYFRTYDNNILTRDLIPARRNSDNVVGMYDRVTNTFFTNSGTGEFIAGSESSNDSLVLQDAIKDSLKSLKAYGKTELKPDTLLDTVVANGGTEILSHDYMDSITAKGKTEQRKLPVGYQELEYIQTDINSYIDTGIAGNASGNRYKVGFSRVSANGSSCNGIIGTHNLTDPYNRSYVGSRSSTWEYGYGTSTTGGSISNNTYYDIDLNTTNGKYVLDINGTNEVNVTDTNTRSTAHILINTVYNATSTYTGIAKYYYVKIYDQNSTTLIMNLIPARNASGVVGMYDTVSCTFFINSGTGSFIAGPLVNLPEEYERIEYIRGTGAQYINTGIKANSAYTYKLKVSRKSPYNKNIFGIKEATGYSNAACLIIGWTGTDYIGAYSHTGTGSGANPQVVQWIEDQPFSLEFNPTGEIFKIDGVNKWTEIKGSNNTNLTNASFTSNLNIYLFGTNTASSFVGDGDSSWYSYQVYNGSTLLQDLVPVKKSNGTLGLFDMVSGNFYTNAGTGTFTAGPSLKVPSDYTVLDYIESTGTQWIDPQISGDTRWVITAQASAIKGSSQALISSTGGAAGGTWYGEFTSTQHWDIVSGGTTIAPTTKTTADLTFDSNGAHGTIGDTSVTRSISATQGSWTILRDSGGTYPFSGKLFDAKVYQNNVLVRNLVPVRRNSDGVISMYDTVSGTLLTNQGTGTFKAGYKADILPDNPVDIYCNNGVVKSKTPGYTPLEYLESTGTQAINTGVKYSGNNFVVEWEAKDNNTSNDSTLFAATKNTPYSGGLYGSRSSRRYYVGTGSGQDINYTSNDSQYHKWKLTMSGQTATLYKDNVQVGTASMTGTIDTTHDIYLFCGGLLNDSGSDLTQFASWSLKSWKLTDNGVVKFDAIPVKNSQDTPGLFDMVSGKFLTNVGTGSFVAGPIISDKIATIGTTETIYKYGKNLFNEKWNKDTGTSTQSSTWGQVVTASGWSTSELIPVVAGKKYTVSYSTNIDRQYVFYYNANGTMQQNYNDTTNPTLTVTIPTNCTHVRLQCHKSGTALDSIQTQLEVGSSATTYEHYTHDAETATCEDLFSLGTYKDSQEILSGTITRNIGIKVLDGTENWTAGATGKYYLNITPAYIKAQYTPLCSHFQMYTESGGTGDMTIPNMLALYVGSVDAYQLYAYPNSTIGATVNTWKAWLAQQYAAGTPVMIIYPLATATTETVSKQINNKETGDTIEVIAGSLENLEVTNTSSTHTIPLPDYPLDINCNNGVLKLNDVHNIATDTLGGYINKSTGKIVSNDGYGYTDYIPVTAGQVFKITQRGATTTDADGVIQYDSNKVWQGSQVVDALVGGTYTVPSGISYIRPNFNINYQQFVIEGIYADGTVETLLAQSKNLFDDELLLNATGWTKTDGIYSGSSGVLYTTYGTNTDGFPLQYKANTQYTLSYTIVTSGSVNNARFRIYYTDNTYDDGVLSGIVTTPTTYTLTSASGKSISKIVYNYTNGSGNISLKDIQLEQGTTATAYEPYIIFGTATAEMLLKAGTYTDTHDVISGIVTRNLGVKVLDGTENWAVNSMISHHFTYKLPNQFESTVAYKPTYCTHFPSDSGVDDNTCKLQYRVFSIRYDAANENVATFKQYLADQYANGTPVIIIYPLATATTETVDKQRMRKGTVSITEASMTGLTVNTTESVHTIPSPDFPLDLYCNNGKLSLLDGYTKLDYIQSSGTQWIDTGITNENCDNYTVRTKYSYTSLTPNSLCGNFENYTGKASFGQIYINGGSPCTSAVYSGIGNKNKCTVSGIATNTNYIDEFSIDCVNGTITRRFNGSIYFDNGLDFTTRSTTSCALFGCFRTSITGATQLGSEKIYYFQIYKDGKLVIDLIPAKRNSDNVIGMYDLVSGQFFTNQGTGTFTAGNSIVSPISIGTPEELTITGKNLLDANNLQILQSKAISDTGAFIDNPNTNVCDTYVSVKPNTVYTISGNTLSNIGSSGATIYFRLAYYNSNKTFISRSEGIEGQYYTFITDSNTNYIKFHYANSTADLNTYVLEEGTRPTQYENYMNINCSVEDLLSVGNYQDIEDLKAGITNRKVGIKVLDGTETWSVSTTNVVQADVLTNNAHSETCISSHFTYTTSSTLANMPDNSFRNGSSVYTTRLYVKSSTLATDTTTWKKYLADQYALGTPVVVVYPLATETTESTITQSVDIVSGTNTIERNSEYLNDLGVDAEFKKLR